MIKPELRMDDRPILGLTFVGPVYFVGSGLDGVPTAGGAYLIFEKKLSSGMIIDEIHKLIIYIGSASGKEGLKQRLGDFRYQMKHSLASDDPKTDKSTHSGANRLIEKCDEEGWDTRDVCAYYHSVESEYLISKEKCARENARARFIEAELLLKYVGLTGEYPKCNAEYDKYTKYQKNR